MSDCLDCYNGELCWYHHREAYNGHPLRCPRGLLHCGYLADQHLHLPAEADWGCRVISDPAECKIIQAVLDHYSKVGKFLNSGRHRAGFLVQGMVVKVPLCDDGIAANEQEIQVCLGLRRRRYPVAECVRLGTYELLAEYVERLPASNSQDAEQELRSSGHSTDGIDWDDRGIQVGRNYRGELVCFDYA